MHHMNHSPVPTVSLRQTDETKQLDTAWISVFNYEQSEATKNRTKRKCLR